MLAQSRSPVYYTLFFLFCFIICIPFLYYSGLFVYVYFSSQNTFLNEQKQLAFIHDICVNDTQRFILNERYSLCHDITQKKETNPHNYASEKAWAKMPHHVYIQFYFVLWFILVGLLATCANIFPSRRYILYSTV
jgi:hypothetical protein